MIERDEHPNRASPQLTALIETLRLMTEQARAYERVLPPNNHAARMAVAALGELARQALAEAQDLDDSLTRVEPDKNHPLRHGNTKY
jgi:hypothetical protein